MSQSTCCHLCPTPRAFSQSSHLSQHLASSHFYCPLCQLSFLTHEALESHRFLGTDDGSREVEIREDGCATWRGFDCSGSVIQDEQHRRVRTGERAMHWFCAGLTQRGERCGRGFVDQRALRQHQNHAGHRNPPAYEHMMRLIGPTTLHQPSPPTTAASTSQPPPPFDQVIEQLRQVIVTSEGPNSSSLEFAASQDDEEEHAHPHSGQTRTVRIEGIANRSDTSNESDHIRVVIPSPPPPLPGTPPIRGRRSRSLSAAPSEESIGSSTFNSTFSRLRNPWGLFFERAEAMTGEDEDDGEEEPMSSSLDSSIAFTDDLENESEDEQFSDCQSESAARPSNSNLSTSGLEERGERERCECSVCRKLEYRVERNQELRAVECKSFCEHCHRMFPTVLELKMHKVLDHKVPMLDSAVASTSTQIIDRTALEGEVAVLGELIRHIKRRLGRSSSGIDEVELRLLEGCHENLKRHAHEARITSSRMSMGSRASTVRWGETPTVRFSDTPISHPSLPLESCQDDQETSISLDNEPEQDLDDSAIFEDAQTDMTSPSPLALHAEYYAKIGWMSWCGIQCVNFVQKMEKYRQENSTKWDVPTSVELSNLETIEEDLKSLDTLLESSEIKSLDKSLDGLRRIQELAKARKSGELLADDTVSTKGKGRATPTREPEPEVVPGSTSISTSTLASRRASSSSLRNVVPSSSNNKFNMMIFETSENPQESLSTPSSLPPHMAAASNRHDSFQPLRTVPIPTDFLQEVKSLHHGLLASATLGEAARVESTTAMSTDFQRLCKISPEVLMSSSLSPDEREVWMEAENLLSECENLERSERNKEIDAALRELGKTATFLRNLKTDATSLSLTETGVVQVPCAICLEPCTAPRMTPCGHLFCLDCIEQALDRRRRCPTCRTDTRRRQLRAVYF